MASKSESTIVTAVRNILDERGVASTNSNLSNADYNADLDEIIKANIAAAIDWAHLHAPASRLVGQVATASSTYMISCPETYIRVLSVNAGHWERATYEIMSEDDPRLDVEAASYDGLKATIYKPKAAFVHTSNGRSIRIYPESTVTTTISIHYIPAATKDSSSYYTVEASCYTAALYYCAYLTCSSMNLDNSFKTVAESLLQ